ncbi:MAG: hypothetical protein HY695_10715 [Deltaproteobacteria bacterium]|nr:hypothetical protein [Deltaproteobacteria bacterium]
MAGLCKRRYVFLFCVVIISGCAQQIPREALELSEESLELRRLQTRRFETKDEGSLLSSGAAVLQDLGFAVDNSESKLGLLVASKKQSAYHAGEIAASVLLLAGTAVVGAPFWRPVNKEQLVRASLVTRLGGEEGGYTILRVTFQRVVWNTSNQVTISELIKETEVYQAFFEKLSKAVFLEAQEF